MMENLKFTLNILNRWMIEKSTWCPCLIGGHGSRLEPSCRLRYDCQNDEPVC